MKTKTPEDRWKAIRRGEIYCAPACGGKCTWAAYQKAVKDADALAKRMGPGWEPEVWENLGWHCKVVGYGGRANIHIDRFGGKESSYSALLSPEPSIGGQWASHASTPEKALEAVLKQARQEFNHLAQIFIYLAKNRPARLKKTPGTSPQLDKALKLLLGQ